MKNPIGAVRLLLPPASASLSRSRKEELCSLLCTALSTAVELAIAESYEQLHRRVITGEADVVWAPPLVCARFETVGIPVLMRAVRMGEATYRAALISGAGTGRIDLPSLKGARAAWVDRESCAGFLLPGAWLRAHGLTPSDFFSREDFFGTYENALGAVARGEADVSSIYCAGNDPRADIERLTPGAARKLHVLGLTDEVPNDGIVVGPYAPRQLRKDLELALQHPTCFPDGARVFAQVFATSSFEAAPAHGYRALYTLLSGRTDRAELHQPDDLRNAFEPTPTPVPAPVHAAPPRR